MGHQRAIEIPQEGGGAGIDPRMDSQQAGEEDSDHARLLGGRQVKLEDQGYRYSKGVEVGDGTDDPLAGVDPQLRVAAAPTLADPDPSLTGPYAREAQADVRDHTAALEEFQSALGTSGERFPAEAVGMGRLTRCKIRS